MLPRMPMYENWGKDGRDQKVVGYVLDMNLRSFGYCSWGWS
jgi:hypothetical protein